MPSTKNAAPLSWLRLAREAAGLSQTELGELSDRTQSQISRYEDGTRTPPPAIADKIAKALGSDPDRLFSDEPPPADLIRGHLAPRATAHNRERTDEEGGGYDLTGLEIANTLIDFGPGPGTGTITHLDSAGRTVAVELADRLIVFRHPPPTRRRANAPPTRARERRTRTSKRAARGSPDDGEPHQTKRGLAAQAHSGAFSPEERDRSSAAAQASLAAPHLHDVSAAQESLAAPTYRRAALLALRAWRAAARALGCGGGFPRPSSRPTYA